MTIQQMEYVVALDEHRHFVRAAEARVVLCNTRQLREISLVIRNDYK